MFVKMKAFLKQYPAIVRAYASIMTVINNIRIRTHDIFEWYFPVMRMTKVTPYGFKLQGSHSIHHQAMQRGNFEPDETKLIQHHLNQSQIFIDVGANIGFYSCLARSMGKKVIAIEPLARNLEYLYTNLLNNNWNDLEVFPLGLSDNPGIGILYGASNTGASLISNWANASGHFQRTISLSTLDILLGERFTGQKIFIKIDVEGVEHQVLMGASKTLKRNPKPTWLVEISLNEFHPSGLNPNYQATFELFINLGYEARTADRHNTLVQFADIKRWVELGHCDSGVFNYIFTPSREAI